MADDEVARHVNAFALENDVEPIDDDDDSTLELRKLDWAKAAAAYVRARVERKVDSTDIETLLQKDPECTSVARARHYAAIDAMARVNDAARAAAARDDAVVAVSVRTRYARAVAKTLRRTYGDTLVSVVGRPPKLETTESELVVTLALPPENLELPDFPAAEPERAPREWPRVAGVACTPWLAGLTGATAIALGAALIMLFLHVIGAFGTRLVYWRRSTCELVASVNDTCLFFAVREANVSDAPLLCGMPAAVATRHESHSCEHLSAFDAMALRQWRDRVASAAVPCAVPTHSALAASACRGASELYAAEHRVNLVYVDTDAHVAERATQDEQILRMGLYFLMQLVSGVGFVVLATLLAYNWYARRTRPAQKVAYA